MTHKWHYSSLNIVTMARAKQKNEKWFISFSLLIHLQYGGSNSAGSGGTHSDNFSPQAVFTSFKLPKPGQNNAASNMGSTTPLQGNEQPLLPTRLSSPNHGSFGTSGILSANSENHGGKILSAPLGGLPAMASQIEEAAEEKSSTR